jgi:hypothetical protein
MARRRGTTRVNMPSVSKTLAEGTKFGEIVGLKALQDVLYALINDVPDLYDEFLIEAGRVIELDIRTNIHSITGNLLSSVRTKNTFTPKTKRVSVMMGNKKAPHAHLVEFGHRQITKAGDVIGFVSGQNIMRDAFNKHVDDLIAEADAIIDAVLK